MAELHLDTYSACSTCRKALRWLRENGVPFRELPIRETAPSPEALRLGETFALAGSKPDGESHWIQ